MYQYNKFDQQSIEQRAAQFRGQVDRFKAGDIDEDEFRALRLRNGLYYQIHAHMLRIAIPYGVVNADQMRMFGHICRTYDKGYGHFTTRQNLQINWPELEDVPTILEELATVQVHAIQTSGNCVRNITSDHLAGIAIDEIEDPRPYCEILRHWSTFHPEFNWLPRKFKFAVTGAEEDRAAVQWHDIGLRLVKNDNGDVGFQVLVGGGMGRTPVIGKVICEFLEKKYIKSYVESILRVYNLHGRRDNKYKARIKILVNAMGIDTFREEVEAEWELLKQDPSLWLEQEEIDAMKTQFNHPAQSPKISSSIEAIAVKDDNYDLWLSRNVEQTHVLDGYCATFISLKAQGEAPGDATSEQMEAIADIAEKFSRSEIRVTHEQNLVLPYVRTSELYALWMELNKHELATPNIGTLNDMICCPGLDFCSLANATTIPVAAAINERFNDLDELHNIGNIKLKMSGCMNACGHHHAGHIGILGVDKKGKEWYQITLGGSAENDSALGKRLGPAVKKEELVDTLDTILKVYLEHRQQDESFQESVNRLGTEPFKEQVYASH